MRAVRWKMIHTLETTPRWLEDDTSEQDRKTLHARVLDVLGKTMMESGCVLLGFTVLDEFYVGQDGKRCRSEFRLRMIIHALDKKPGVDVERLGANLCVAIDALKEDK